MRLCVSKFPILVSHKPHLTPAPTTTFPTVLQPLAIYEHSLTSIYFLGGSEESGIGKRPFKEQANECGLRTPLEGFTLVFSPALLGATHTYTRYRLMELMNKWGDKPAEVGNKKKDDRCVLFSQLTKSPYFSSLARRD